MSRRDYADRPRAFSRKGILTPELVTTMLLFMVADNRRRGYSHLMQAFWDEAAAHGVPMPSEQPVSGASFCEARQKLSHEVLRDILYETAWSSLESKDNASRLWKGKRVFAVDGTKINLQRHPELDDAFGTPVGAYCPQILVSVLVDCCSRIAMDLEVSGYATDEREHLRRMLGCLDPGDVVVLDRGYPSHELIQDLTRARIDFLIRVPASHSFTIIDEFRKSGSTDRVMKLQPPEQADSDWVPVDVRVVRLTNDDGDDSFYLTSLRELEFSHAAIAELYHLRWESEEFYKALKSNCAGQGQLRSLTRSGVVQEVHAAVLYIAISRFCMQAVEASKESVPDHQLSQKGAILALGTFLLEIFLGADDAIRRDAFDRTLCRIASKREKLRPGRSYPRRSFKPTPKWAPAGRRNGA